MTPTDKELVDMLNQALAMEYACYVQYLDHATKVKGLYAEKIIERLEELASDEAEHAEKLRTLISDYLDGETIMSLAEPKKAKEISAILKIDIQSEKQAIDLYKKIYQKIIDNKDNFQYIFVKLEHEIRHIIMDEEEHIIELSTLLD